MDDTQQQSVSNPSDAGAAENNSADADLDSLMSEWNQTDEPPKATAPQPSPDVGKLLNSLKPVVQYAESSMLKEQQQEQEEFINGAVSFIKEGEGLAEMDGDIVEGYLYSRYNKSADFKAAYDSRGTNPDAWNKALEDARTDFAGRTGKTDVRSDIEAAKAAVSGSSDAAPSDDRPSVKDLNTMSDHDFEAYKRELAANSG